MTKARAKKIARYLLEHCEACRGGLARFGLYYRCVDHLC